MALKTEKTNKAGTSAPKVEWRRILIPSSKLTMIYNSDSGKCSLAFALAEHDDITFMISSKLVRVNSDRTGFIVSLPVNGEEIKLSQSIPPAQKDGKWERKEMSAEKIEDLGYPFAE